MSEFRTNNSYSLALLCEQLDRSLANIDARYLTAFFGVIDTRSGLLRYCRAGHPEPFLLRRNGNVTRLNSGSVPIGMNLGIEYEEAYCEMLQGDRLICFSDGITEIVKTDGSFFGEDGLETDIQKSLSNPLDDQLDYLFEAASKSRQNEELLDDVSLLGLELL